MGRSSSNSGGFDLANLIGFLWQKKIRITLTIAILTALGTSYVKKQPKIYSASSTLLFSQESDTFSISSNFSALSNNGNNKIDTYIELIRSRQFALKIVEKLQLQSRKEFKKIIVDGNRVVDTQNAISKLLKHLQLSKISNTDMLRVTYESTLAYTAAEVVNTVGPTFFEYQTQAQKKKSDATTLWLDGQLLTLSSQLESAQTELEEFMQVNGLIDLKSQVDLAKAEISKLIEHRLYAEKMKSSTAATMFQIIAANGEIDNLMQVPVIWSDTLIRALNANLFNKQLELEELSKRYKYKHHKYIAAKGAVDALQANLEQSLKKVIDSFKHENETIKQRYNEVESQLARARSKHAELGAHEFKLASLMRKTQATQKLYDVFLSRLQETEILQDLGVGDDFAVVDYAQTPSNHIKPRVLLGATFSLILSSIFSIGIWLLIHLVADKKSRFISLLRNQSVSLLGELPKPAKIKKTLDKKSLSNVNVPKKAEVIYSECVRALRSELMVRSDDAPIRTLVVASVQQGKRRSKLAIELAKSFAGLDKSIIIDADLRQPQIGFEYGLDQLTPGLTNFISRRSSFSDSNFREKGSQLSVMPSGAIPSDPLVYLTKPRFGEFIKRLGVLFERVIIETPPVNAYGDTLVVSKVVDGVVLLCDLELTESADLLEAIQRFQDAGAPLLGVVFENTKNIKSKIPKRSRGINLVKKVINY
jgi:succinoglycan biosynthesis transport protein ExoP